MKIFTERAYRERLFEEREKTEKEVRLDRTLLNLEHELFDLKCRVEQLEHKESEPRRVNNDRERL